MINFTVQLHKHITQYHLQGKLKQKEIKKKFNQKTQLSKIILRIVRLKIFLPNVYFMQHFFNPNLNFPHTYVFQILNQVQVVTPCLNIFLFSLFTTLYINFILKRTICSRILTTLNLTRKVPKKTTSSNYTNNLVFLQLFDAQVLATYHHNFLFVSHGQ